MDAGPPATTLRMMVDGNDWEVGVPDFCTEQMAALLELAARGEGVAVESPEVWHGFAGGPGRARGSLSRMHRNGWVSRPDERKAHYVITDRGRGVLGRHKALPEGRKRS